MNIASAITFDTAEREYNEAWTAPSNTRFELPPVDVNTVLKKRYRVSPEQTLTRAMIWDMETKKAWDPLSYIPYVVSQARSWGRTTLRDGSTRFSRSSLQRGWIASDEGLWWRVPSSREMSAVPKAVILRCEKKSLFDHLLGDGKQRSALCQKRTKCTAAKSGLFDHVVRSRE